MQPRAQGRTQIPDVSVRSKGFTPPPPTHHPHFSLSATPGPGDMRAPRKCDVSSSPTGKGPSSGRQTQHRVVVLCGFLPPATSCSCPNTNCMCHPSQVPQQTRPTQRLIPPPPSLANKRQTTTSTTTRCRCADARNNLVKRRGHVQKVSWTASGERQL